MDYLSESLKKHLAWRGKLEITPKVSVASQEDLSLAYTPGVAQPCLEIKKDPDQSYALTGRWNTIAVVTDGSAVLGLGDIGPEAGMPVMEGKCVLFKAFGNVDAIPLCIRSKEVSDIVNTVALLAGSFGGINLEDISAPRCFEIERQLKERCDIPIFHDDQHGTAVVALAALVNALKVANKRIEDIRLVLAGAGAAGLAISKLLLSKGLGRLTICDKNGVVYDGNAPIEVESIEQNKRKTGLPSLADALRNADVFIGVSAPDTVSEDMVRSMNRDAILFTMANPRPEIMPACAKRAGALVVGTGRSDFPNQINNVVAFPGILRGALDVRARDINDEMKIAAAYAIAGLVGDDELCADYIMPRPFDPRLGGTVAEAVARAARASGVARI